MKATQRIFGCGLLVAVSLAPTLAVSANWPDKLAADLRGSMSLAHDQRVIVTYAPGLDETGVRALVTKSGRTARRLAGSQAIVASVSRREIETLESDGRVVSISPGRFGSSKRSV